MSKSKQMAMLLIGMLTIVIPTTTLSGDEKLDEYKNEQIITTRIKEEETVDIATFVSAHQEIVQDEEVEPEEIIEEKNYIEIKCELTFYTDLASCNGDNSKLTASGAKLNNKTLAVPRKKDSTKPVFPFGTKVEIDGYGERTVEDTGNPKYLKQKSDGTYIFDVFMARNKGETDKQYKARIMSYGRVQTTAKVYLEG